MTIAAKDVMSLRQKTGLGMMDCKQALAANDGDMTAAEEWIRAKRKGKMDTRTERTTGGGRVAIAIGDGGAAIVLSSLDFAKKHGASRAPRIAAISTVTPTFPDTYLDMPSFSTDSAAGLPSPDRGFRDSIAHAAYEEAGIGPEDLSLAEVYDLSSALELDWYENIGLCKPGQAERLLRDGDTCVGGRIPVNASGGLGCFGEAVPAQALAQVCELTWQIRGEAGDRQVEGARIGITANQGLFGHGSSVIVKAS